MNDATLISISIISAISMLAGIQLMNINWFKRQKELYRYKVKTQKLKQKGVKVNSPKSAGAIDLLDQLKSLDPSLLHDLVDTFAGGEIAEGEDITGLLADFAKNNPEIVQNFLKGVTSKSKGDQQSNDNIIFGN